MEGVDLNSPIVGAVLGIVVGIALFVLSRYARRLPEPIRGFVRLEAGGVSFTEIFAVFALGYGIGSLATGPSSPRGGPPLPPGGRFIGGPFNPFLRGGLPVAVGTTLALIMFLYRVDIIGKLSNPQSHKSVAAIIGAEAQAVEDIPAGGHGQITFRDPGGSLVGIMASADVPVARGARVRIVGTKGLNPLVVPETPPQG
jgi:membrane protein implicated in regulation of membrane protease activity